MANIRSKDINDLSTWDMKELRKLRITIKNRMNSLDSFSKAKELPDNHPLKGMELGECKELLLEVQRAEKKLVQG